jgi:cell division protein FtsN
VVPAAAGEATWFVNFSSYTDAATARRRAAGLSVDAGRVVVQDALSGDRTVFRVRVVELENREQADAVADKLAKAYGLSQLWVGKE